MRTACCSRVSFPTIFPNASCQHIWQCRNAQEKWPGAGSVARRKCNIRKRWKKRQKNGRNTHTAPSINGIPTKNQTINPPAVAIHTTHIHKPTHTHKHAEINGVAHPKPLANCQRQRECTNVKFVENYFNQTRNRQRCVVRQFSGDCGEGQHVPEHGASDVVNRIRGLRA